MIDPFTLSMIASGIQTGVGALQSASAAKKRNAAISKLEQLAANSPLQKESKTLNDYYQESLNRYKENPFTTPYYLENLKQSERAATQALGALQTRGAAIGGVSRINRILADAKSRGVAGAMQNKNAQFGQLGGATQMKRAEERELFDINKMTPYNRRLQLKQMEAEGYTSDKAAYDQAVQSGIGNLATAAMYKGMYSTPSAMGKIKGGDLMPAATYGTNYIPFDSFQENTPLNQGSLAFADYYKKLNRGLGVTKKNAFGTNYNF